MSTTQLARRAAKIEARHTPAQELRRETARTQGAVAVCLAVLKRGFWGRLKWLVLGK